MAFTLSDGAWSDVGTRYAEPHRRYHDQRHLTTVLTNVDRLAQHSQAVGVIRLAALFHDAVYIPGRSDNESASADLARSVLEREGADPGTVNEVVRLVLLTEHHDITREGPALGATDPVDAAERDPAGAVLCDADLAILGASPIDYAAYAADVRAEWPHLDDAAFNAGRLQVLLGLLDRRWLFTTAAARGRWQARARHNLETELTLLRAST